MEFSHLRGDNNRYYAEEEVDEDDRYERCPAGGNEVHHFLPLTSSASSSSSAIVHWIDGSEASPSSIPPAVPPKSAAPVEKEQMFEKVVTPSDVGKLNRLVIPKQHAEKYFPLDASTHDKGLLLNFEDRNGKPWRFRYSYWNSSQSYVMTKGWSRFVKEKRLAAGDIVSFGRGVGDNAGDRLFIDWKRRPDPLLHSPASFRIPRFPAYHYSPTSSSSPFPSSSSSSSYEPPTYHHPYISFSRSAAAPWAAGRIFVPNAAPPTAANYFCLRSTAIATPPQPLPDSPACLPDPMVLDSVPVAHSKAPTVTKRVRLFGVNLEQQHELETADNSNATGLLRIQSRSPLSSPEPRLSGVESSPAASSSSSSIQGAKECQH